MVSTRRARAFTLIELLVVIVIIAILLGIAITVGRGVTNSGRARQTEHTLRVLDTALSEYIHSQEGNPPPWAVDPRTATTDPTPHVFPVVDGAWQRGLVIDSVALFMLQARGLPQVESKFRDLDARIVREVPLDLPGASGDAPMVQTVLDGWGQPIRYVHPAFGGLVHAQGNPEGYVDPDTIAKLPRDTQTRIRQIRRNPEEGDADGGRPVSNRPYFYSSGPDGDPATVQDNIYITRPQIERN